MFVENAAAVEDDLKVEDRRLTALKVDSGREMMHCNIDDGCLVAIVSKIIKQLKNDNSKSSVPKVKSAKNVVERNRQVDFIKREN